MTLIAFIFGLALGIGILILKQYQFKRQVKEMLSSLTEDADVVASLPASSLVRREITRLVAQNQQLEEQLHLWHWLLDRAPIGYLRIDEENQLLWCNEQARQLLKIDRWQPDQIRLLLELVRSYELDQLIEQTRRSQQPQRQEWVYYSTGYRPGEPQGTHSLTLKAFSYPLPNEQVGVFLKNLQPLVDLSRSRDRAFSDLAHELRTPLTSMVLVGEALQKRLQNPERRWVEQTLQETHRLIELTQSWLDLSRLNKNPAQHLSYQSVDLRELIFSSWQILEPLAKQKKVSLLYSAPEHLYLQADYSRLTQVFLNLFDNGIKHSSPEKAIRVTAERVAAFSPEQEAIQIDIIDSGTGFAEADLPYIFERLYRGDPSRTRQLADANTRSTRHGSGLGLSIVEQIVQAHGGSIIAKNHPDGGAWLQITLPDS